MSSLKIMLSGIVLILASLFCMAVCAIKAATTGGGPELSAIILFALGLITFGIGLFVKDNEDE